MEEVDEAEIEKEMEQDQEAYDIAEIDHMVYRESTRMCLTVRKWISQKKLTAFTANFMEITKTSGLTCMPFLEASKAMTRGVGYAGEGDVLAAALVGALLSVFPETSFTEMFCPDWKNNNIFLSHMGEMNLSLSAQKPVLNEKAYPFTDAGNTTVAYGRFRSGKAVLVNLAQVRESNYSLILSPIELIDEGEEDKMVDNIRGWFRPPVYISEFLETFSRHGGTHHSAIVYGDVMKEMEGFAEIMGWETVKIGLT